MVKVKSVILAWEGKEIIKIGRLTYDGVFYKFYYLESVKELKLHILPLIGFPDLNKIYISKYLFPIFTNRIMQPSRPDYYKHHLKYNLLNKDLIDVLEITGGRKETDDFIILKDV